MITNYNDYTDFEEHNKIYIPSQYNNSNYRYRISNETIIIQTNNNCYQSYNTTYCDCYTYLYKENLISNSYECNVSNSNATINYNYITSDINYSSKIRNDFLQEKSILFFIFVIALILFLSLKRGYKYL